jgi:hypothetical protein
MPRNHENLRRFRVFTTENKGTEGFFYGQLAGVRLSLHPVSQQAYLGSETLFCAAQWTFEEAGQPWQLAPFPRKSSPIDQTHQIDHQRCRQDGITALPGELHGHRGPEKAPEMNMVPGSFPVTEAFDVLN